MARHLIAVDQGTTGTTAMVVSDRAEVLGQATREFPQHFPKPGWVEHDPDELWESVLEALGEALVLSGVKAADCAALGIANQRETTLLWDRASGKAIHAAIVWQDRRTAGQCQALVEQGHEPLFRERTGLVLDPYFSGTKIAWLLNEVPGARRRADRGELAFGTVDSYLLWRLTAGQRHITDITNASRTLLLDLHRGVWDEELATLLGVPLSVLPEVRGCAEIFGHTRGVPGLPDGIPIAGMAGDQQAALFGQTCFAEGDAKCTYGTGAFLLSHTGQRPVASRHGLLTTVAWRLDGRTEYALEGSAFVAGAAVQWLRDKLGIISSAAEVETLARQVDGSGDVVFVPALVGLGAPHWDPHARGLVSGLTRDTSAAHLARAVLEGIAFQIDDLVLAMEADAGTPIRRLRADGGAAANDLLMQFQADLLGVPVDRPACIDTTALGAAYLAGLATGIFTSREEIARLHRVESSFAPVMDDRRRREHRQRWQLALERAKSHGNR